MTDYEVRPFRPADREPYLELYGTVFCASPSPEWFEWKYGEDNPYVDEPAVYVAERDGEAVAALVVGRGGLPAAVLRRFGFHSDAAPPLSAVASTTTMVARPIGDAGWRVAGRDLRELVSWRLTFAELDSA